MNDPLVALARRAGILPRFRDVTGRDHKTGRKTMRVLLQAMGFDARTDLLARDAHAQAVQSDAERKLPRWLVIPPDHPGQLPADPGTSWAITLETGDQIEGRGRNLPALPLGLHVLTLGPHETTLLVAPATLPLPDKGWGVTAPLWGLRGPQRAGFGDFDDLLAAGLAVAKAGGSFIGINPVHAGFPTDPTWYSPYSPSHRRRLNPLHLPTGEGLKAGALVDYATEIPAKLSALRHAFATFEAAEDQSDFRAYLDREGESLRRFALHQALSGEHGPLWTDWPPQAQFAVAKSYSPEMRFHAWMQWKSETALLGLQASLHAAGMAHGLYLDLAVGVHPGGAETWTDPDFFAPGVSLGAPPDPFAQEGQRWNLAPFNPHALAAAHFRPLAETLRTQLRFAGALRIDHIIGFDRAFWAPDDSTIPGAYVTMPRDAMLAVIRIEAARAGAVVIGEDLGNVPAGLRSALADSGILGCRVAQFEHRTDGAPTKPRDYPAAALASFGTHDLPTWLGWQDGTDIKARQELGEITKANALKALKSRASEVQALVAVTQGATADDLHAHLGKTGSALIALQAEDILGVKEQTNLPGTVFEHPNWRRKLPVDALDLDGTPALAAAGRTMKRNGR